MAWNAMMRVTAGQERATKGTTEGRARNCVPENGAFRGKAIKVWRMQVRIPGKPRRTPPVLVTENPDDIGFRR